MQPVFTTLKVSLLTLTALLGLAGSAQAQSHLSGAAGAGTVTFKVMPVALLDPATPTFRFGAEYRLSPLWGVEASYGHQVRNLGWGNSGGQLLNDRYQKLHTEVRYYIPASAFYAAVAGFRVGQQFDAGPGSFLRDGERWQYSSARVQRTVLGGLLKVGVVLPIDAHWRLDMAVGGGLRAGNVRYQTREESRLDPTSFGYYEDGYCGYRLNFAPTTTPGTFRRATVAFDVRLGYEIGR